MSYRFQNNSTKFDTQRHIVGMVISVCASAFVASGILTVEALEYEGTPLAISVLFLFFPVLLAVCGIAALLVGVPTTFLLSWIRLESLWVYMGLGFLLGTLIAKVFFASEYRDTLQFYSQFGGVPGAVWGLSWWLAARHPSKSDSRA